MIYFSKKYEVLFHFIIVSLPFKVIKTIMSSEELQNAIWKIANEVRGAVDGWDFKQFVLGPLFYRFISEHFTNFIEGGANAGKSGGEFFTPQNVSKLIKLIAKTATAPKMMYFFLISTIY